MKAELFDVFCLVTDWLEWKEVIPLEQICRESYNLVPEVITSLHFTQENVHKSQHSLPFILKRYHRVRTIKLSDINFSDAEIFAQKLAYNLRFSKHLRRLIFQNSLALEEGLLYRMFLSVRDLPHVSSLVYTGQKTSVISLLKALNHCLDSDRSFRSLRKLDLSGSRMGEEECNLFRSIIPKLPSLRILILDGLGLSSEVQLFSEAIKVAHTLRKLSMALNCLESEGVRILAQTLMESSKRVDHLILGSNWLGPAGIAALSSVFIHVPRLRILDLSRNRLGEIGARTLATCIFNCKNLESLNLKENQIKAGISALMPSLVSLPKLRKLNLSLNMLKEEGAQIVAEHLSSMNLNILIISQNALAEGFNAIIKEIPKTHIRTLIARSNLLRDSCLTSLIQHLPKSKISKLSLDMNAFTYNPLRLFLSEVHKTQLRYISIGLPGCLSLRERKALKEDKCDAMYLHKHL
jgi:Ran GTPase-activating protein (RanGAP) involved in mRNA processing and transport